jgi:5-methylcytosine-specific restriction endonuclease McrA
MPAGSGSASARGYGAAWRRRRRAVLERDAYTCHWCGAPATQADHLVEKIRGGTDALANLVASCAPCNARRGAQVAAVRRSRARLRPSRRWVNAAPAP